MVDSNLKFLRKENGFTQAQLAEKLAIKRKKIIPFFMIHFLMLYLPVHTES